MLKESNTGSAGRIARWSMINTVVEHFLEFGVIVKSWHVRLADMQLWSFSN